jgi:predicted dehydrogenase
VTQNISRPVRWGLIGCGDISRRRVAPALRDLPNCELVAVNRAQTHLAEAFATTFGAKRWYADWQALLQDPEIEAVYIATPVNQHAEQTIAAAKAGKHVLCEKPMAMTVRECEQMLEACEANNVRFGIAYYRHFYPVVQRIKQLLTANEIGIPVVVQLNVFSWFDPQPGQPRDWLIDRKHSGGGPMFDVGGHRIEVLLNLFGRVSRVAAAGGAIALKRNVEDTAIAILEFEHGPIVSLSVTHAAYTAKDTLTIFGTTGSIQVEALNDGNLAIHTVAGTRLESHPPHDNLHQPLINDFAAAVREGRGPLVNGEIGKAVAEIQEAINMEILP